MVPNRTPVPPRPANNRHQNNNNNNHQVHPNQQNDQQQNNDHRNNNNHGNQNQGNQNNNQQTTKFDTHETSTTKNDVNLLQNLLNQNPTTPEAKKLTTSEGDVIMQGGNKPKIENMVNESELISSGEFVEIDSEVNLATESNIGETMFPTLEMTDKTEEIDIADYFENESSLIEEVEIGDNDGISGSGSVNFSWFFVVYLVHILFV